MNFLDVPKLALSIVPDSFRGRLEHALEKSNLEFGAWELMAL